MSAPFAFVPGAGVLVGLAIGDAAGAPFESYPGGRKARPACDWTGAYRSSLEADEHGELWPEGAITDDTQKALALGAALLERGPGPFHRPTVVTHYLKWLQGKPRGMGGTVRRSLESWAKARRLEALMPSRAGHEPLAEVDHLPGPYIGSGALMSCAPLALRFSDPATLAAAAVEDCRITHWSSEAEATSVAFTAFLNEVITTQPGIMAEARGAALAAFDGGLFHAIGMLELHKYRQTKVWWALRFLRQRLLDAETHDFQAQCRWLDSGDVADVLVTGLWTTARQLKHVGRHGLMSMHGVIEDGIAVGGDVDTRLAVAGAAFGALLGPHEIPGELIDGVERRDEILAMEAQLLTLRGKVRP